MTKGLGFVFVFFLLFSFFFFFFFDLVHRARSDVICCSEQSHQREARKQSSSRTKTSHKLEVFFFFLKLLWVKQQEKHCFKTKLIYLLLSYKSEFDGIRSFSVLLRSALTSDPTHTSDVMHCFVKC